MSDPKNRIYFYIPVMISVCFSLGIIAGHFLPGNNGQNTIKKTSVFNKLDAVLSYIKEEYVDDVSDDSLIEKSIPYILQNLDPHSVYIPAVEFNELNEPLEGNFEGIGVQFNIQNDTIVVINTIPGGPS
jgi:carboxyl-terminal processing protease